VKEFQTAIGAGIGLLDLFNGRVGFALRAASYVDGAIVLVKDLAQFLADTCK